MTTSISTPRLRVTYAWYLIALLLIAVSERPWVHHWSGDLASAAGLLLMAGAALGRVWTSIFIAGRKDEALVTGGPYSLCRHPLYALSLLGGFGVGLAARSVVILSVTLALLALLYWHAIRLEERLLQARWGDEFRRYCDAVPLLIPRNLTPQTPPDVQLNVGVYWKAFLDAGSFIGVYVLIAALDGLRARQSLPSWLVLW